ncbi:39S ribosomal protein L50, mitochondrial isoform X2 [Belonocnema kinseyi]|uniref:39S ribosomal protein L50, mitochondrial isoform X2 n=1 Tax=Belonocnema kinseyi TaxID=2817044 RepID=UPI00143DE081|nr:39S ribosomal protein L50, mitochondrial isoform X2 [Belonocnema kinseyi]
MAALTRHAFFYNFVLRPTNLGFDNNFTASVHQIFLRGKKKKAIASFKKETLESTQVSLAAKGFLRGYKPYEPMKDVSERLDYLCQESRISTTNETRLENPIIRCNLLIRCQEELKQSISNSMLCTIKTIGNLRQFYHTPVNSTMPLDSMRLMDLPKNLHIQYEYHRFQPGTDTMFNGKTAFPKSSTIVTGLKYKKKYRGHS